MERPPHERAEFVARTCGNDPEVRREVESLLAHEGQADELLESPAWNHVTPPDETGTAAPAALAVGAVVAAYRIVGRLGAGGMGEVYRATDSKLQREVALKVLAPGFTHDREWLSRFQREARVLASINHPHIAAIYGLEESDGVLAIAMELVEGPTLAERIGRKPIPVKEALAIARQIAEALEYAHEKGIVHRDLKPANVKLRPDGVVKVLDFGLAKAVDVNVDANEPPAATATRVGIIVGTPAYMAPEQAAGAPVDRRADIWAFGVVLFEMLSGRQIYARKTTLETLAAVARDEPQWDELPAETPAAMVKLLRRCLDKDAKHRLRDIGEARIALEEDQPEERAGTSSQARRWRARGGWIAAGLLAAALAVTRIIHLHEKPPEQRVVRMQILPPGSDQLAGDDMPLLSPDGTRIVFSAGPKLFVRSLGSLTMQELPGTGTSGAYPAFWSPDGRYVAFFANADLKLRKVSVFGGLPLPLCDTMFGPGGAWNRDGVILFAPNEPSGLMRIGEGGGMPAPATRLDAAKGETHHAWPSFLPDGKHFLFTVYATEPANSGVFIGSLGSLQATRLLSEETNAQYTEPGYILFSRGGSLMAQPFDAPKRRFTGDAFPVAQEVSESHVLSRAMFSASSGVLAYRNDRPEGPSRLRWFDRKGGQLGDIGQPGPYNYPALSPDGHAVAVDIGAGGHRDTWIFDLVRKTNSRLTSGGGAHYSPSWSPDGRQVAFSFGDYQGRVVVHRMAANGAGKEEPAAQLDRNAELSQWTADGKYLIMRAGGFGRVYEIWAAPLFGGGKPFPVVTGSFNNWQGRVSPDGRWIAYVGDETGRGQIYVQDFPPSGGKWQISTASGYFPRWRADGRELFYRQDSKVMSVDVKTSPGKLEAGIPKPLFDVPNSDRRFDVSADGQKFLMIVPNEDMGPPKQFTVVINWPAGVKN
jgi:eukaryotic-like serine/threonine-protein kinase